MTATEYAPGLVRSPKDRAKLFREIEKCHKQARELQEEAAFLEAFNCEKASELRSRATEQDLRAQDLLLLLPEVHFWPWRDEQQKRQDLASLVWEVVRP